ncbi:DUF2167 domain-containing protein [Kordiimonas gwangyangensis]|uniref:DUF2167 domain-containing protein n=1 Tax=Kordiimonas gwangyangensis TaxID=288022 RepID=UPI00047014D2|nr:DUF2167 domain-containing protein [Kordiimonas gwangyangensis]
MQLFNKVQSRANATRSEEGKLYFDRWLRVPELDPELQQVEYAFELKQGNGATWVNLKLLKLTREGYLAITWIGTQAQYEMAAERIRTIATNLIVDEGENYDDFKAGDLRAKISVAKLVETTLSGKTVDQIRQQMSLPDLSGIGIKLGIAIAILAVGGLIGVIRQKRLRWQYLASAGAFLAIACLWLASELRENWRIPSEYELEVAEGIVKEAHVNGRDLKIELMEPEIATEFQALTGEQAKEIFLAAKASFDTGARVTISYVPPGHAGDAATLTEFCKDDETCVLSFADSTKVFERMQDIWLGVIAFVLAFAVIMVVVGLVWWARLPADSSDRRSVDAGIAGVLGLLFLFAGGRVAFLEHARWSAMRADEVERFYNDVGYNEAIEQADRALRYATLSDEDRRAILNRKADALQEFGLEIHDDAKQMEALAILEGLQAEEPDNLSRLKMIGYSFIYLGAYPEALAVGERLVERGEPYWGNIRIALVHRVRGDYAQAESFYQRAHDAQGGWTGMPLNYHRAKNQVLAGENEAAIASIEQGLTHQEDYSWAFVYRACAKANMGDTEGAKADYAKALEIMREERGNSSTPDKIFPYEQEIIDLAAAYEEGPVPTPEDGNYCTAHIAGGETLRERSSLLPATYMPAYLQPAEEPEETSDEVSEEPREDTAQP